MINFTDMTGLASSAIGITALIARLPGVSRLQRVPFALVAGIIVIVVLFPLGDLPLAAFVRSWTGDLSITSLVLLTMAISSNVLGRNLFDTRATNSLLLIIVLAALGLYPMALGLGDFDPYRLGFGSTSLIGGLLLLALFACFHQLHVVALSIALAVLAWSAGWYESSNLWNYLLDPLLVVYAAGALFWTSVRLLSKLGRSQSNN